MSPQSLMQIIQQEAGATVEVCAICLPGLGADEPVLLDGIGVVTPDEMASRLVAPNRRLLDF
jgi:phage tail protein X